MREVTRFSLLQLYRHLKWYFVPERVYVPGLHNIAMAVMRSSSRVPLETFVSCMNKRLHEMVCRWPVYRTA